MILIITGTNTNVGKTIATAALALRYQDGGAQVRMIKPAQTGSDSDIGDVEALTGISGVEYAHYPEPLAPNLAARRAGMPSLDLDDVAARISAAHEPGSIVLVEGAGGLLVRMAETWNIADLAATLNAPAVVVTSTGLGSLNLAELTVEAAVRRGVEVCGLIGGTCPLDPDLATQLNLAELPAITGVPLLGCLPPGAGALSPAEFKQVAEQINLPFGGRLT